MTDPRTELSDDEWNTAFGLHSGYPLCCVTHWVGSTDPEGGGACPPCANQGINRSDAIHYCTWEDANCRTYLDEMERRWLKGLPAVLESLEVPQGHYEYGFHYRRPMPTEARDIFQKAGYRMVHLCWPTVVGLPFYHYIFRNPKSVAKTNKCHECNSKYSLKFPTAGTNG